MAVTSCGGLVICNCCKHFTVLRTKFDTCLHKYITNNTERKETQISKHETLKEITPQRILSDKYFCFLLKYTFLIFIHSFYLLSSSVLSFRYVIQKCIYKIMSHFTCTKTLSCVLTVFEVLMWNSLSHFFFVSVCVSMYVRLFSCLRIEEQSSLKTQN